jgi:hypothetical protein
LTPASLVARAVEIKACLDDSNSIAREVWAVPRISSFYGITIWMYYDEIHHAGRPHFHARYGDDEGSVDIESLAVKNSRRVAATGAAPGD